MQTAVAANSLFIVPLKIQISSKQFWPLNDWSTVINVLGGAKWSNLCSPCLYNICLKEKWEEDVKWISIQISPASVCFRVSLNSSDVQGEKARFVLNLHFYPVWPQRSALSIHKHLYIKEYFKLYSFRMAIFLQRSMILILLVLETKICAAMYTNIAYILKTSIEYCLVYGTFSPFYYISLTWSVIELVR